MTDTSLEHMLVRIRNIATSAGDLRARILFNFGDQGKIFIDSTLEPPRVDPGTEEALVADLTVLCSLETFTDILNGAKDPAFAFLTGQVKIQGPIGLAMKLNAFLEDRT